MSIKIKLPPIATRIFASSANNHFPVAAAPYNRPTSRAAAPPQTRPHTLSSTNPVIIDHPPTVKIVDTATLSNYLWIGRTYHPLCRHAFIEKRITGYYHYEQRILFSTCAIAAAYAGAFGPHAIERPDFSYSMALWRLGQKVGYDLAHCIVPGPTGRRQSVAEEMMQLVDEDLWTREGVAEWLASLGL